ncbi:ATP-binding cassette domain-containing protein [Apilactobacillus timberlakei]|uniref:ATP-binding cassette domain-containing protein n=1 Tax=Apilactobacillus timberlakei TaxID=2008380 RepID=UPI001125CD0C|nr:ATP-binding cassette domain-containing protein [Apilactobacillus timberlakei]TPR18728.1 ATP-binding cassette domain-containing protein [Apilactobacillus timberlakei]TPR21107.1 ATP-binding cassette domain-containing protein [Apilactobacillus timberlakei]TPR23758.1 ATP-binding cassette domain-containing protein [Apilactobacillus timberlakei]
MDNQNVLPTQIEVRGGNVHNLKNIDVDIPLNHFVAISGPSGSGKSSLAMGILYAEGSRRYLEALSTYTRRRIGQSAHTNVREVRHIPSAIALKQRPNVPSERSTVGSMSEIFNIVRLIFSRLGSPVCPNGHRIAPSLKIAQSMDLPNGKNMGIIKCPTCGVQFMAKSAEDFAFNSGGACPKCEGTGQVSSLDPDSLIEDEDESIDDGAVASWHLPGRSFMSTIAKTLGVRTDIPYKKLTNKEKNIVLHGEKKQYPVDFHTSTGRVFHTDNALYENAYESVYESMKKAKSSRAVNRISKFFHFSTCPVCHGSRLNPSLLNQLVAGKNIAEVSDLTLGELEHWQKSTKQSLPGNMQHMADILFENLDDNLSPLLELGLDYLTLSRSGNTLSTGELQRIQLAKTLRTETTGVLYVLDEPSVGLHPDNIKGLIHIFRALIAQGNSLVVVDHEMNIISAADWVIEIGPGSGDEGGNVIAQGTPKQLTHNQKSLIGPFIDGKADIMHAKVPANVDCADTNIQINDYYNLHNVESTIPGGQITAVTGFSGAGKTSLILNSLVPAIREYQHAKLPKQVANLTTGIKNIVSVDAKPVGKNERSTLATYTTIMDHLRHMFARLPAAKDKHYGIGAFSYNNKQGACPTCGGLGNIHLDVQYLPDIEEVCPTCHGNRFNPTIQEIKWHGYSIVDLLKLSVKDALPIFKNVPSIESQLQILDEIGLNYLHLGESTPSLSGGEAQRLKLVKHLSNNQSDTMFVFDEPSVGLHPIDVQTLIGVVNQLKQKGATIILITHDLDLMTNADYMIDLGPKGGNFGGKIMASGKPNELIKNHNSLTLQYLAKHFKKFNL